MRLVAAMFWRFLSLSSFLLLLLLPACQGQQVITLTAEEFFQGTLEGRFDAIVDVRSAPEFRSGHIEGATLVANLASTADEAFRLIGCESCSLVVYCNTGNRAASAIERLRNELGFGTATLYNGLGLSQWRNAGFPIVIDDVSIEAPCTREDYVCVSKDDSTTAAPTPSPPATSEPPQPSLPTCGNFEGFCETGEDCCSQRCVVNQCKKKIPNRKISLASSNGFGGSAGVAKRNNNGRRRYLKSSRQQEQQQQRNQHTRQQRLKGEKS